MNKTIRRSKDQIDKQKRLTKDLQKESESKTNQKSNEKPGGLRRARPFKQLRKDINKRKEET